MIFSSITLSGVMGYLYFIDTCVPKKSARVQKGVLGMNVCSRVIVTRNYDVTSQRGSARLAVHLVGADRRVKKVREYYKNKNT